MLGTFDFQSSNGVDKFCNLTMNDSLKSQQAAQGNAMQAAPNANGQEAQQLHVTLAASMNASAQEQPVWQWQTSKGEWKDYKPEISNAIEEVKNDGYGRYILEVGQNRKFLIYPNAIPATRTMRQWSENHSKSRAIRRITKPVA